MPRLPVILANEGIAAAPGPRFPRGHEGGGEAAAIATAGASISKTLFDYGALEQEKKRVAVNQEVQYLHAEAETRLGMGDSDLRTTERDPDAYNTKYDELVKQVTESVSKQAKYPESAQLLQAKLAPSLARHKVEAFKHSNVLYVDRGVAQLDATLDNRKVLAGIAQDDQDFQSQYEQGEAAIKAAEPLVGANKAGDMRRKFREDVLNARALKESNEEPEMFATNADVRYAMLDPKVREQLKEAARRKVEENLKEAERVEDRLATKMEKLEENERQLRLTGLSQAATDRQLTGQQVLDARDRGDIHTPTEFEHFMTLATKQNTAESDPQIWNSVQSDIWSERPTLSEARIRALMARHAEGGAGLNGEHGRMALMELGRKRDHAISEGRTIENQQHSRKTEAYAKAKEEALRSLGITTPMSQLDKKEAKLVSDFEREYNARVLDPDGNVRQDISPRQVMTEVLPAFMNRQSSDARLGYKEQAAIVSDLVGSTVPEALDPKFVEWYAQQQKATEPLGADPKTVNIYRLRRDQLLRLARSRAEYLQAEARKAAAGVGGGKATGGYQAPKEGN